MAPKSRRSPSSGGRIRIPAPDATSVVVRLAPLSDRDRFDPSTWRTEPLVPSATRPGHHEIDLDALGLADGVYEYELVLDGRGDLPAPDPYADAITRFGGYRGTFTVAGGRRVRPAFSWEGELGPADQLPGNEQLVIAEIPMRWMASAAEEIRQVGLGTFDRFIFERLDQYAGLGVNALELLPIQDSADTLNWGYGSRFFFAPDIDMGTPTDLKLLIKRCHQRGIRVILDVVMNHSRDCPLERLATDWFYLKDGSEEGGRPSWGGRIFRYRRPAPDGSYPAREFLYEMGELWVEDYHVDGFRIDEFKGIDNWEFVQTFRDRTTAAHQKLFPSRPFLVIAEDTWRRPEIVRDRPGNPAGRKIVDAMWNFAYRDDVRRLARNRLATTWGEPSRRKRITALIGSGRTWDELSRQFRDGFAEVAQPVNYVTSHDVEAEGEQRLMNQLFGELLQAGLGTVRAQPDGYEIGGVEDVRRRIANMPNEPELVVDLYQEALDRVGSCFALLMTSVGVPMFLAGEEFADVHDLEHGDARLKMSDPVDWNRRTIPEHAALESRVRDLVHLRTSHSALHRSDTDFFYFHPEIDGNDGLRVFAYCRTGGQPLGSAHQVVVVANCGPQDFPAYDLPWPWAALGPPREHGAPPAGAPIKVALDDTRATVSLRRFQVRVFET